MIKADFASIIAVYFSLVFLLVFSLWIFYNFNRGAFSKQLSIITAVPFLYLCVL